jgi:hypothetical protein
MTKDQDSSPASKEDIALLMEQMGSYYDRTERRIVELEETLEARMERSKEETIHEFKVVAEDIRHDFRGAFHDKLEQHDERIVRLERRVTT